MKFVGGPWTAESRAGTFARFFEAHAGLERAAFLEKVRSPHLVIGAEPDPATWDQGIVVRLDKKTGYSDTVDVGRDVEADVTLNCPTMSKAHARFTREGEAWFVEDLHSMRGTTVDGVAIPRDARKRLDAPRPRIGFGPDVTAVFLGPAALFDFLEEARARRAQGPVAPSGPVRTLWPTWSLLQDAGLGSTTELELPRYRPPEVGAPKEKTDRRFAARKPLRVQLRELLDSPRRLATVLVCIVVALAAARIWGYALAVMMFGDSHPEWFNR